VVPGVLDRRDHRLLLGREFGKIHRATLIRGGRAARRPS
jgi:hypothetical protein